MKTVKIVPAEVYVNQTLVGTATSVNIGGSCEIFGTSINAWANLMADGMGSLLNKNLTVTAGCSEAGIDWSAVEADVLSQLGLVAAPVPSPAS